LFQGEEEEGILLKILISLQGFVITANITIGRLFTLLISKPTM
jgi:hypothetical protein